MLCPSCRKLISVSAEKCPFCGASRPGLWGFGPALSRLFHGRLDPVALIPIVCIALYVIALLLDPRALSLSGGSTFRILSPSQRALFLLGSTSPRDLVLGRPWTMLSAIYLHGGILHLVFNVMWTRYLGPPAARAFGPARFFLIWSVAGVFGFLVSNLLPGPGSVGASGSIFGLLGALIVYARAVGDSAMARQLVQWVMVFAVIGVVVFALGSMSGSFGQIDHLAHAGGFAGGWIMAHVFRSRIGKPDDRRATALALIVMIATAASFVLSFVSAIFVL
jgi:rhomboid protease GluP